jgi:glycosyltransferase involved in cell wall biosynthesis
MGHKALLMWRFENTEVLRLANEFERLPEAKTATIVATYRRPQQLVRAVQSALTQSVRDHVVVVVDDGGGLPELPDDPRLFAISLSSNTATAGLARNVGIRLSRSKYVAFLDDDNEWEPNHLEVSLSVFESETEGSPVDVTYTAMKRILPDGRIMDVISTPFDRKLLGRTGYVDTNCLVIRRFPKLRFSRMKRAKRYPVEDWELVYRLSRTKTVVHVPIQTVRYLVNPESYVTPWPDSTWSPQEAAEGEAGALSEYTGGLKDKT